MRAGWSEERSVDDQGAGGCLVEEEAGLRIIRNMYAEANDERWKQGCGGMVVGA